MSDCDCASQPADPDRRLFLTRATLTAVGSMLLSSCGALVKAFEPTTSGAIAGPLTITVGDYPTLATVGAITLLRNVPAPMAAVRVDATTFAVFSRYCPHRGAVIGLNGSGFKCPNHGALFNSQGANTGGFRTGSLRQYTTSYDPATGVLTIS
jgi:Rieske Fe-S protein